MWGLLCLALTVVWVFVWPRDRAGQPGTARYVIVRWFHALTWLLLALAAFIGAFDLLGGAGLAKPVALLSLAVYLIFMGTLFTSPRVR